MNEANFLAKERMKQHLDIYRERIESQKLSGLELSELQHERMQTAGDNTLSNIRREMALAEANMLEEIVRAVEPTAPTAQERAAMAREAGDTDTAAAIEHSLKAEALEGQIAQIKANMQETGYGPDSELGRQLTDAEKALEDHNASHPVFSRIGQARDLKTEAENLRTQAAALEKIGQFEEGQKLRQKSDAKFKKSTALSTPNYQPGVPSQVMTSEDDDFHSYFANRGGEHGRR